MSKIDETIYFLHELLESKYIVFHNCPMDIFKNYEYYYCQQRLYLVRDKRTNVLFICEASCPKEAIKKMILSRKRGKTND